MLPGVCPGVSRTRKDSPPTAMASPSRTKRSGCGGSGAFTPKKRAVSGTSANRGRSSGCMTIPAPVSALKSALENT